MSEIGESSISQPSEATVVTEKPYKEPVILGSQFWNARSFAHQHKAYSGRVDGGIHFYGTPYQIDIPVKRNFTSSEVMDELESINSNSLSEEAFRDFYKHVDMLISFENAYGTINDPREFHSRPVIGNSISTIIERSGEEGASFAEKVFPDDNDQRNLLTLDINLRMLACLEIASKDPEFRLDKQYIAVFYHAATENNYNYFLPYALFFDERNKKYGEGLHVEEMYKSFITPKLLKPSTEEENIDKYLPEFWMNGEAIYPGLLTYALLQTESHDQIVSVVQNLAPRMGIERMRQTLRDYVKDNPSFRSKFDQVFTYLGLDPKTAQVSLEDIYHNIDFSNYKPNEDNQKFETELLLDKLRGKHAVLDVACGTGRLLESLDGQHGLHVAGIDMMDDHITSIKNKHPDKDVRVGSWFSMPFPDKEYDAAYCLGRSAMHNTTIPDFLKFLEEMRRVIKDNGVVIMDLPDPNVGEYKENIEETRRIVKEKELQNVLPGLITDSPDLEHYFDRYAPNEESFNALTLLAGFSAKKIEEKKYKGASGKDDVNVYWELTKTPQVPISARFLLLGDIYGGRMKVKFSS